MVQLIEINRSALIECMYSQCFKLLSQMFLFYSSIFSTWSLDGYTVASTDHKFIAQTIPAIAFA